MSKAREMPKPDVKIYVESHKLTDDSLVWNVEIGNIILHAVTEDDAIDLASKIHDAIESHTNEAVAIDYVN